VKLPYPVLHTKGTAKYDKASKVLTVTLPVVPPPFVQRSFTAAPSLIQETEAVTDTTTTPAKVDTTRRSKSTTDSSSSTDAAAASRSSAKSAQPSEVKVVADHSRWVQEAAPSKKFDFLLQQQKLKKAQHAPVSSATDNTAATSTTADAAAATNDSAAGATDGDMTAGTAASTAADDSSVSSSTAELLDAAASSNKEFIACAKWQGSRAGYVFKKGTNGQGYYRDSPTSTATADTAVSDTGSIAATTESSDAEHVYDSALHQQQQQQQQQKLFKWRENERTVSIVVDVAGIDADSVQADWQQRTISITATVTPPTAAAAAAAAAVKESLRLKLNLHGAIDTARCRYDVASRNMAVVLYKAVPGFWGQLESTTTTASSTTTTSSSSSANSSAVSGVSKDATAAAATGTASDVQQGAVAVPDLTALPFKNEVMYELD
jgi:HSP20 family molecular chaperone IbpA